MDVIRELWMLLFNRLHGVSVHVLSANDTGDETTSVLLHTSNRNGKVCTNVYEVVASNGVSGFLNDRNCNFKMNFRKLAIKCTMRVLARSYMRGASTVN